MNNRISKVVGFPDREAIDFEAATWVARRSGESLGAEDEAAFRAWLRASDLHRDAYARLARFWDDAAVLKDLDDIADSVEAADVPARSRVWQGAGALAAAAGLMLVLGALLLFPGFGSDRADIAGAESRDQSGDHAQDYVTGVGEQRTVVLADGSRVRLNTSTAISVALGRDLRSIRLLEGEAFFEVEHDADRPFLVQSRAGSVRALGTSFSTRLRGRQTLEVTVAEGLVEVTPPTASERPAPTGPAPDRTRAIEVAAGSTAVYSDVAQEVKSVTESELGRRLSWRSGIVVFAGEPLSGVVEDVSRYTDIEIRIADASIESLPIGGYFRVGELDALFESLELVFGIEVEHGSRGEIVLARGPGK